MAKAPEFDPAKFKAMTREQWDTAAAGWNRWIPEIRAWVGPATETMLDMAGVTAGSRVLDIAAGTGDQSQQAAERVGPTGHVLASDISPGILEFAGANARAAGFENIETQVMDAEALDVPEASFDAVISRLGLMFLPDLDTALAGIKRALKPGGKLGAIVFSEPESNLYIASAVEVIRRHADLPAPRPNQPGVFRLGPPGLIEDFLSRAGFRDAQVEKTTPIFRLSSAAEYITFMKEGSGPFRAAIDGLDPPAQEAAWADLLETAKAFETENGYEGRSELLIVAGTK